MALRPHSGVVLAAAFLLAAEASGQGVVASQGAPNPNEFRSPMVLSVPLKEFDPARWNDAWTNEKEFVELKAFRCEAVFIERLKTRARKTQDRLRITASVKVRNPNGNHDKLVYLELELKNDDEKLTSFTRILTRAEEMGLGPQDGGLKVEESDSVTREYVGEVFVRDVKPTTELKITMTL